MSADRIVRVGFATAASFISAALGYGYHWENYHNNVEHRGMDLPQITAWVTAGAPWVFLVPLAVLGTALIWRRHPLVVLIAIHAGWLFAIAWPALCLWAWEVPFTLL